MIKEFIKKHWPYAAIIGLAAVFFIGASSYNYFTQYGGFIKWSSPDETANYIFTKLYAEEGRMTIFEKYNLYANDIIHPRSTRSDFGKIKPVSFLGIILIYGKIAALFGVKVIPYLTPAIASVGIIYFYLLIKKIFGRTNALISALLLASFPVFIYYSVRSMFHNALFVSLLIIGLYYSVLMVAKNKEAKLPIGSLASGIYASLAGFLTGLAIITRASEILWLLPMFIILWLFNIKKAGAVKPILFLSFLFLAMLPMFYNNQILYGAHLSGGYSEMNGAIKNITEGSARILKEDISRVRLNFSNYFLTLKNNIFYFGFHSRQSFKMLYYYFTKMFWWIFWPSVFGFLLFLKRIKKWRRRHWAYFSSYFVISIILLFYYGSWKFHDNPDPKSFTIGNSYTRYWLPIYLGAMPLASLFIIKLTKLLKKRFFITAGRTFLTILIFFISIRFVLVGSEEGLIFNIVKLEEDKYQYEKVLGLTENNSAIITLYHDKLLFPERKVIVGLFDNKKIVKEYAKLINYLSVYYYNFTLPAKDFNYLNSEILPEFGLRLEKVKKINSDFTLYRIKRE